MTCGDTYGHVAYVVFPPSIASLFFASKKEVMPHLFRPDSFSCLYQYLLWVLGFTVNLDEWICALCIGIYCAVWSGYTIYLLGGQKCAFCFFYCRKFGETDPLGGAPERQSWFPRFRAKGCVGGTEPTAYPSHWKGLKWLICWVLVNSSPNFNAMN